MRLSVSEIDELWDEDDQEGLFPEIYEPHPDEASQEEVKEYFFYGSVTGRSREADLAMREAEEQMLWETMDQAHLESRGQLISPYDEAYLKDMERWPDDHRVI